MPNFAFTRDIPFATHNPSSDQPIMQTNTNSEDSIWPVDHFGFNDNNGGYHQQVHLKNESAPGIGTVDGVLYANVNPTNSWPFWQNSLGSFPMITQPIVNAFNGTATMPGGVILKWGVISATGGSAAVVFPVAFLTNIFTVQLTLIDTNAATGHAAGIYVLQGSTSITGFTYIIADPTTTTTGFLYFAMGN